MKKESFTADDAINGLKHLIDDHSCCSVFCKAVIKLVKKQQKTIKNLEEKLERTSEKMQDF